MLYRRGGNSQLKTAGVALVLAPASGTAALLTIALLSVVG
ncbi:putative membrane protein [Mycobacteroides abscessus 3A-0810-R]|nr:putative membrane protein [Mycobacteroides abscessus 3A-0122-R]EIV54318.1 putative membrane protein [Mycobacteroides abscessus 3A-0930-R]EIV77947.1 putative membrane protein [Mycobacteroides abscessus 3A-0810-R]